MLAKEKTLPYISQKKGGENTSKGEVYDLKSYQEIVGNEGWSQDNVAMRICRLEHFSQMICSLPTLSCRVSLLL